MGKSLCVDLVFYDLSSYLLYALCGFTMNYSWFCHGLCFYCDALGFCSIWVLVSGKMCPSFFAVSYGWVLRYSVVFELIFEMIFEKKKI